MADKLLREGDDPMAAVNRRISLKVRFRVPRPTKLDSNKFGEIMNSRGNMQGLPTNIPSQPNTAGNNPGNRQAQTAHVFTPKEIVKAVKRKSGDTIKLPPEKSRTSEPTPADNIFEESPILGAPDAFDF